MVTSAKQSRVAKRMARQFVVAGSRLGRLLSMALWVGGFTFYSGVVVEVLHGELDSLRTGTISQQVTDRLNLIGLTTLIVWWGSLTLIHRTSRWTLGMELGLLLFSTSLLAFQAHLHNIMDSRIDEGRYQGFYPFHQAYLIASTLQWVCNVLLLGLEFGPVRQVKADSNQG